MAESVFKNEYPQEDSRESFTLAKSFGKLQVSQERMQAEENNQDPIPMIVDNAVRSGIPDIKEKKNSSEKRGKKFSHVRPIRLLDPWNRRFLNMAAMLRTDNRSEAWRNRMNIYKHRIIPDAGELREKHPNCIPVTLEKDPRSDIPDADMKKFLVYGDMPLRDFVSFIRMRIRVSRKNRIFVYCRNTEPPFDALMSTIDEENKDEDGFLHITFSGEGRGCGSNEEQECSVPMILPA